MKSLVFVIKRLGCSNNLTKAVHNYSSVHTLQRSCWSNPKSFQFKLTNSSLISLSNNFNVNQQRTLFGLKGNRQSLELLENASKLRNAQKHSEALQLVDVFIFVPSLSHIFIFILFFCYFILILFISGMFAGKQ
jgi:hypothetical protein